MDLCHVVVLNENFSLSHLVMPKAAIDNKALIMAGPFQGTSFSRAMIALRSPQIHCDFASKDVHLRWSISIVDELEQRNLIETCSQARSIFWLGELLDGLKVATEILGIEVRTIRPNTGVLVLEIIISHRYGSASMVGTAMCLMTLWDSLLFARGLALGSSHCEFINDDEKVNGPIMKYLRRVFQPKF